MHKFIHRSLLTATVSFFMLLGAGCTSGVPAGQLGPAASVPSQPTVSIANLSFQPTNLTVASGTSVTWTNNDSMPHTVTADDGSFNSDTIQSGGSFSHTFTTIGTVAYHCSFHGSMHGSISVTK